MFNPFIFTELSCYHEHVKQIYISTRFSIQRDIWQLLHPKHFVNVLIINHMECSREKEIIDVATIMRHGLALNKKVKDRSDNANAIGLLKYFTTPTESEEKLKSIKTHKIFDIFKSFRSKNGSTIVPRFILIEGAPGMGKTTLCKEIAYQWAEQHLLKDTELLFLIYLRDPAVANIKHIKDFVHYFYNFDEDATEQSKQFAKILNNRDSNDVTIIFDGFDEFDSSSDSLITDILDRKVLPQCRIVVTSRLTASDRLHRIADVRVEVLGFSDESKIQYIKQELKEHPDEVNKLQSYLNTHPSIENICYMPMMMTILVYVFKEKGYLPTNSTELYEKFVALTISRQSKSDDLCVSIQTLPTECKSFLFNLSKFAFLTLQSKQKVFSKEDIKNLGPNLTLTRSDLESLGLINSIQYFCTDKGNTRVFNFLHLSIHEYLAAYYISSTDQCRQFNELESTFLNEMYQETWNMFIAMNKNKKTWLDFQNYSVYSKDIHYDSLSKWIADHKSLSFSECFIQLYNIMNANSMSSDVQIIFSKNDISAANTHQEQIYLSLWDAKYACYIELKLFIIDETITTVNSKWFMLFQNLWINNRFSVVFYEDHFLSLVKVTQKHIIDFFKHNNSITDMMLIDCHITKSSIDAIQLSYIQHLLQFNAWSCFFEHSALIKLTNYLSSISTLLSITFHDIHFSTEQVDAISSVFQRSCNLKTLNISNNNLQGDIAKIAKALEHTRTLEVLDISYNNIPQSAATAISTIISLNTSLREFYTAGNNLKSSVIVILECLSRISSLQILDLNNNQISVEAGEPLASVVARNTGLEELFLSDNNLGEGMLVVTKALQQLISLKSIDLGNTNISKEASSEIPLVVKSNRHLEKLWLYNNLQFSAITILQSLSTISTLTVLNINNTQTTDEAGEALAAVVIHNTGLEELYLSNYNLGKGILVVTKALQQIKSLRSISLCNINISREASCALALVIQSNKHLEKLQLNENNLKSSAVFILQSLSTISTLKFLDVNNNSITEEASEALASVVIHNTGLEELYLSDNNLGEGMLVVTKALQQITSLKSIYFDNTNISKEASGEIPIVVKSNKHLEKLWLNNNNLKCSAIAIFWSLSTISTLSVLNISNTQTTDEAGEALASVVIHNTGLKELYLSNNNLGEGMLVVTKALQQITSLRSIGLCNINISREASCALALVIRSNRHLEKLWLHNNNLQFSAIAILQSLSTISTLRFLIFNNNLITKESGEALASVVLHNTGLEELYLNNNNLGEGMLVVTKVLQQITSLRSIAFGNTNISKEASGEIPLVVKSNKYLQKLQLNNNNLKCSAIAILQSLSTISTLKFLDVNNNLITEEASEALATVVLHNTGLEELYLSDNNLGEGMLVVIKALQQLTSLKSIDFDNTNISKEASSEIPLVVNSNKHLEKLWLNNNDLKSSAIAILQSLSTISTLTVLNINNTQTADEAGEALAAVVIHNTGLKELYLSNNNLGEGMLVVTKALQQITSLRSIDLGDINISREASCALALVIRSNMNLEKVWLHNNNLQFSAIAIFQSLSTISTLKFLYVNNNSITEEASEALASVVIHNTGLEVLYLSDNNLGEGMLVVIKALQQITSLKSINFDNTNISKEASNELPLVIKSNKHFKKLWLNNNNLKCSAIAILKSLSTISTLIVLNINNAQLTDEAGEVLASVVLHNKTLEELHLADNNLGKGMLFVTKAIQQITSLRSIVFGNTNILKEASSEIPLVVKSNIHLKELRLYNNNLKCSAIAILQSLSTISTLKFLNINNTQITDEAVEALASVVLHNKALEELQLSHNNICEGMLVITKALQQITSLRKIGFGNTNISREASRALTLVIQSNKHLEKLQLNENNLKSSAVAILQSLSTISTLKFLNVNNNSITEEASEALASVVIHNTGLEEIYLSDNNLGEGMLVVIKALQQLTSLISIDFGNTNISKEASCALALVIKSNKHLEKLCLYNNNLQFSAIAILQSLSTISTLKVLNISNTQITDEAGEALAAVVMHNIGLEELNLSNNNLGEGMLVVTKALQQITSLRSIDFDNTNISKEASCEIPLVIKSNIHLKELRLYNNNLRCSAIAILQSLNTISTLSVLNIINTQTSDEASEALAAVVMHNIGLEELYLNNNNLAEGMLTVTKALQQITSLKSIDFGNTNISKEASCALAHVIQSNMHLEKLWLYNNNLQFSAIAILQSLSTISTLKLLNINNTQTTHEAGEALASVVLHNKTLKELNLSENNLGEGMLIIIKVLQQLTSLKSIDFGNTNISKEASYALALVIQSNKHLEKLWLYNNNLQFSAIAILQSLSTISTLKFLNVNNNSITEEASEALASVVIHNTGLEEIYLSDNNLGEGMLVVIKALQQLTSIKTIDFGNTNISKEASYALALVIQSNKHLEKLWLYNNNLQFSAIAILQSLSTISTLKVLNISNTQITDEAGEALAAVVMHNIGLEELYLSNNNLGEGMLVVTKALQQLTSLKSIDFGNTNISKEASCALAHVIQSNMHLEKLWLYNNNLQFSAIAILQSLSTISTLKVINIYNTQTTDEAGEALAFVVLHNKTLEELYLAENNLGEGILIITKALQQMTSLRSLNLGKTNISKEASVELALAIQSNKHLKMLLLYDNNSAINILQSLSTLSTLEVLNINGVKMDEASGKVLATVINNNTGITELHFESICIHNHAIIESLQNIRALRSLNLGNNNLPEIACIKLAAAIQSNNLLEQLCLRGNNLRSSIVYILQALHCHSTLKLLDVFSNPITKEAGNVLANVISKNIKLQHLHLNLMTPPQKAIEALLNLTALQTLVFCTCNISEEDEINLASTITNNKSLTCLSLPNVNMLKNVIIQSIKTIFNLETLWLEDNLLLEEKSDDLSLAISSNRSLEKLILLDNMLQTGLIKIAKACNKLSNIKVLQLAHNCIVPSKVVELTSVITQNTSVDRVLLGGITLNAAEYFHLNINEVLCKTDISYKNNTTICVTSFNHCTSLEMIYLEMLRKQIDNQKKCLNNVPIYTNAKNFVFIQKLQHYFNQSDITQLKTHDAKQKLLQVHAKKMISSLYILDKVKVIDLENNNIDEDASHELATALHSNNVLEQLWLRGNKLNTAGALYILNSLEYLTTLQVLDLSYNNISSQSTDGIAAVIDSNLSLNQLWLDGNDLHSTGTIKICKALKKIRTLSILSLCNNGITNDAADELSAVITQNVLLEDLLLSNNQLHSTGIELIAESLNKLIKLRKLDLFNNNIGKEGASSLAVVVQNSTSLQDLFLSSNNLETSGALEICNALSHICSLHVLTLSNNNINDEVTSQLIEVLNNNHLYALLIGGNGLECGGLKIAQVIENGNIAMQLLDLSDNKISEQDKEKIKVVFSKRANFQFYV